MTAVVGLAVDGAVFIGGDAARTDPSTGDRMVVEQPKVFAMGDLLIGAAGSFRVQNLLRYQLRLPKLSATEDPTKYLVTHFARKLRTLLHNSGSTSHQTAGDQHEADTLVGLRGRLFVVQGDFSVVEPASGMAAVGSGSCYALGALHANGRRKPEARLYEALNAAATYHATVTPPFTVLKSA